MKLTDDQIKNRLEDFPDWEFDDNAIHTTIEFENFREVEVNPDTEFFAPNGKPKIWYDKENNVLTYYTAPGINPETEQTVKQITPYIIQTHVMNK